jgi:hypothetical protein
VGFDQDEYKCGQGKITSHCLDCWSHPWSDWPSFHSDSGNCTRARTSTVVTLSHAMGIFPPMDYLHCLMTNHLARAQGNPSMNCPINCSSKWRHIGKVAWDSDKWRW